MNNYSKYNIKELERMAKVAFSEYYKLATIPCGSQPPKSEFNRLQKATDAYEEIREEIVKRIGNSKSIKARFQ